MPRLHASQSSEDTKTWPLSSPGSSAGMSVQQGFVASRVRALQQQQNRELDCNTRPRSKPTLACSHISPKAGPFDASLKDRPADSSSNIAIPSFDNRSDRPSKRSDCNQKKACWVTSIPEQLAPRARSSANVDARSRHSNYEQRHTHIKTKTLSCVKESMYPRSVPPLDDSPGDGKSFRTNPAHQQPEPCSRKELSPELKPVANHDCDSKRCSSDLSLSSNRSESETGDPTKSFEGPSSMGGAEPKTSDTQSTRTGSSINCSEPLALNQPSLQSQDGFDSDKDNRHGNVETATAFRSSTPTNPDASIGDSERLVVNDENQTSTNADTWTTKADDHVSKERMTVKSLSGLETHSSAESLVSNDFGILERRTSSLAIRDVSEPTSTHQIEPNFDKQAQKDPSRRNGSTLGNLFTGKWLRTVVESKTPQVNQKALRRQGGTPSTSHGTGKEIDGGETTDRDSARFQDAEAGDAASTTSSSQTTVNVNAMHDGSTVSRRTTPPATPGPSAEQSETVPKAVSAKRAMKDATREGQSPFHQSISVPATSAGVSPLEYPTYPAKSQAVNRAAAEEPAAVTSGDLRLTITFMDAITHSTAIRKAKVTVLLETEEDLMVEAKVKKVEHER